MNRDSWVCCNKYCRKTEFHTHPCHFPAVISSNLIFFKPQPPQLKMTCGHQIKQEVSFPFFKKKPHTCSVLQFRKWFCIHYVKWQKPTNGKGDGNYNYSYLTDENTKIKINW